MLNCLAVGLGGFVGSVARYLMGMIPLRESGVFPANTLLINVIGAFLIGLIAAAALRDPSLDPRLVLFLKVGICGGFTTFSTFSLETLNLLQDGAYWLAALYVLLSVLLCVAAVFAAQMLVK